MGRSNGASFEIVTGNLVEEFNGVPFEFFNGVKLNNFTHNIYKKLRKKVGSIFFFGHFKNVHF
jgi:hypothetical protein